MVVLNTAVGDWINKRLQPQGYPKISAFFLQGSNILCLTRGSITINKTTAAINYYGEGIFLKPKICNIKGLDVDILALSFISWYVICSNITQEFCWAQIASSKYFNLSYGQHQTASVITRRMGLYASQLE